MPDFMLTAENTNIKEPCPQKSHTPMWETSLNRQLQYNLEEVKTRSYKKHRRQIPDLKGESGGERYVVCEYIC